MGDQRHDQIHMNKEQALQKNVSFERPIKNENTLNLFKAWVGIKEVMNISKKRKTDITYIQSGNKTVKTSSKIVNEFTKHFTSIAKKIEEKLVRPKHKYYKYLNNQNNNSYFISPTIIGEVLLVVKEVGYSKSTEPASIPSKF